MLVSLVKAEEARKLLSNLLQTETELTHHSPRSNYAMMTKSAQVTNLTTDKNLYDWHLIIALKEFTLARLKGNWENWENWENF